ncbi:MAG TPA: hypothetical protein VG796_15435 [Verrucomicrobiales bacterium]|jgi:hypothetical protein|nr:hypothetical protein [Verrucomicrobiales bacterium]
MTSRLRIVLLSLLGTAALATAAPQAGAQAADPASHPACKVVEEYLRMILLREYKQSANIMDENALAALQSEYVQRIKQAPTMEDEENMIRRLGKSTAQEIAAMKPREFYTAYNTGLQKEHQVSDEVLAIVRKTLNFKVLSVAQEDEKTVHILVRTKHENGKVRFESLDLISLLKNGDKWLIAPNQQAPKVTKLDGSAAAEPPKAVDPVKKPVDPVKPAAPPKSNGPKRKPNP